jgi:hypothetical protein
MNQIVQRAFARTSDSIGRDLAASVQRSTLCHDPFDHIYMERVLDPVDYQSLLSAMPDRRFFHELKHEHAMRADGSSTRLRMYLYPELLWRLPAAQQRVWIPVARALCSRRLEDAFKQKFRRALEDRFDKPVERLGIYPVPILLRDQPGYRIGIHSDVPSKAITVQFYLPRDGSQEGIRTIFHEGEKGQAAKRTTQMPFMPATGYAFPVSLTKSWHSAAATSEADGERISMMVTYYVADDIGTWIKFRLRRAALSFGVHPRG